MARGAVGETGVADNPDASIAALRSAAPTLCCAVIQRVDCCVVQPFAITGSHHAAPHAASRNLEAGSRCSVASQTGDL
jgi:hypothetical protein